MRREINVFLFPWVHVPFLIFDCVFFKLHQLHYTARYPLPTKVLFVDLDSNVVHPPRALESTPVMPDRAWKKLHRSVAELGVSAYMDSMLRAHRAAP